MIVLVIILLIAIALLAVTAYEIGYDHGKYESLYEAMMVELKNATDLEKEINERSSNKREE